MRIPVPNRIARMRSSGRARGRSPSALSRSELNELSRLETLPRFQPGDADLLGGSLRYVDAASLVSAFRSIFVDRLYEFRTNRHEPAIIDGGANIGLASLFWARSLHEPRIIAFEPDPKSYMAFSENIRRFALTQVEPIQAALWTTNSIAQFETQGADAGHISARGDVEVTTIRLGDVIGPQVDLLKLDIEGAEVAVLTDAEPHLERVRRVFVEYHSFLDCDQELDELLGVFRRQGFRYWIRPEFAPQHPFLEVVGDHEMDLRLNIFATRTEPRL